MAKKQSNNPEPSQNGDNGDDRDDSGRFAKGNKGGPGNPHAKKVHALRAALLKAVTPEDITGIAEKLVINAKTGDIQSIKELFDRLFGKPNTPLQADDDPSTQRASVTFNFDHDAFAKMFSPVNGRAVASPDDSEESVH